MNALIFVDIPKGSRIRNYTCKSHLGVCVKNVILNKIDSGNKNNANKIYSFVSQPVCCDGMLRTL